MPTNLKGPNDNLDLESSHVLPALIRRFHDAQVHGISDVTIWGRGHARREFLHVDDLADACLFLMREYDGEQHVNVGTGEDLSIRELAERVRDAVHPGAASLREDHRVEGMLQHDLDRLCCKASEGWQVSSRSASPRRARFTSGGGSYKRQAVTH